MLARALRTVLLILAVTLLGASLAGAQSPALDLQSMTSSFAAENVAPSSSPSQSSVTHAASATSTPFVGPPAPAAPPTSAPATPANAPSLVQGAQAAAAAGSAAVSSAARAQISWALGQGLPDQGFSLPILALPHAGSAHTMSEGVVPASAAPAAAAGLAISAVLSHFLCAFYSRIPRSRILEHPTRRRLLELVRETPGLTMLDAQSALDLGWGTLIHHVERLETEGFIVSDHRGSRRLFAAGELPAADRAKVALLASPARAKIGEFLADHPGASQKDMCAALGLSASVASKHVAKLRDVGLITEERSWREVRYFLKTGAAAMPSNASMERLGLESDDGSAQLASAAMAPSPVTDAPLPTASPSALLA
ncbi:MAG: winged helix-turn-helix transcriptional regulator [Thermoplasmatota archaeon]